MPLPGFRRHIYVMLILWMSFFITHSALAFSVTSVRFGTHPETQRLVVELSESADFRAFVLMGPNRLVIDMPTFDWKVGNIQKPGNFPVQDIRFGALGNGLSRIVIETSAPVMIQAAFMLPKQAGQRDRLVIDFKRTSESAMRAALSQIHGPLQSKGLEEETAPVLSQVPAEKKAPPEKQEPAPTPLNKNSKKPLIIIDPGHGGPDPGARGANGRYEKDIVLAVGLELKKQLEESGQYRVLMTRSTDVFIPLAERVRYARRNNGDLFISLHADSIRDQTVNGASVYTLSETASDAATAKLAERENKSDLIAGIDLGDQDKDVANILLDLATRDTMNQSKFLANTVVRSMDARGLQTLERPHRSAGFAVLKAPDIPSILVEMGYVTNRSEVVRLSSPEHRRKIASTLKNSVDTYFQKVARP